MLFLSYSHCILIDTLIDRSRYNQCIHFFLTFWQHCCLSLHALSRKFLAREQSSLSLSPSLSPRRKSTHTHSLSLSLSSPPESVFTVARSARSAQFLLSSRDYRFVRSVLPCSCIVAFDPVCRTQPYYCSCCLNSSPVFGRVQCEVFLRLVAWIAQNFAFFFNVRCVLCVSRRLTSRGQTLASRKFQFRFLFLPVLEQ